MNKEQFNEDLANMHSSEIQTEIIIPAIKQILSDCEDFIDQFGEEENEETIKLGEKYLKILKEVEE